MAISVENHQFIPPSVFCGPADEVGLELGIGAWDHRTRVMDLPGQSISFTIFSAVLIQFSNVTDGQGTDRRTSDDSKDRAFA